MVDTIKFSEFADGGDLEPNQTTVGLDNTETINTKFNNPFPLLPPGTTGDRPAPAADMYYRLRFNTTTELYEYYSPTALDWIQVDSSASILPLLASHAAGEGASLIGLEDQGTVLSKTVQDLANASLLSQTDNGTLVNGVFLNILPTGFASITTGTGALDTRVHTGTANEIDIANGDGSANPVYSLSATLDFPGTFTAQGTTDIDGINNDDTLASASATTLSTDLALKTYIDNRTDLHYMEAVLAASTGDFASAYDNGTSGVGATLTATSNGAFTQDGEAGVLNGRYLQKDQSTTYENGIYTLTQVGDGSNPAILTRATDFDTPSEIDPGDIVPVLNGTVNGSTAWIQTATVNTIGSDAITFSQWTADFSNVVTITGTQTVTGSKTFNLFSGTLDGDLDADSNNISNVATLTINDAIQHAGDTNNQIAFGTDTQDFLTGGASRLDLSDSGMRLGGANSRVTTILDEDDMASDSDTALATQQSIKTYVDGQISNQSPWVLLATASPSGVANVDFTNLSTDFFAYKIFLENVHPATDGANFQLLVSTDNGATFITSAASYRVARDSISTSSTTGSGSNSATNITMVLNVGNVAGTEGIVGEMQIINPADSGSRTGLVSLMHYINAAGETHANVCGGSRLNAEANNAIRLLFSSGNIASGTIKLYGIRAS